MYKRRKIYRSLLVLLLAVVSISLRAFAAEEDFPARPVPPRLVNDLANMMNEEEIAMLENKLVAFSDSTSNQIAIVTIKNLGQYEIADYAVALFNKWGIGTQEHKNGVLILASLENRKMWITTGYGLEGALPDGLVGQIVREEMVPPFKKGDYYQGFDRAVDAIMDAIHGEYQADKKGEQKGKGIPVIVIILIMLVIMFIVRRGGGGGRGGGGYLGPGGWIAANMIGNAIGRSMGGGGWGGGRSSGGGFGGFGGGSSGGGGAGGSW